MTVRVASVRGTAAVPREAWILWSLSALFLLRVVGQVLVEFCGVTWLPPSPEWYSGLLPYPLLLPVQIVILILMAWTNANVMRRRGFYTAPHPRLGLFLLVGSLLYVAVMVGRYFISGHLHPERRFWPPGSVPILFHFVLAGYLYVLSRLARHPVATDTPGKELGDAGSQDLPDRNGALAAGRRVLPPAGRTRGSAPR